MTLSEIRESARNKADEEATGFISNVEINRYLNQGLRLIYGKIAQRFEDYFITLGTVSNSGRFTTTVGQMEYALPADLMKLVKVEYRQSGSTSDNDWRRIQRLNISNDSMESFYPVREGYIPDFGYFVAGNTLYLKPVPAQAFTVRMWFVPRAILLEDDTDEPVVPEEYHELISEYAAIQCLRKSGETIYKEAMDLFNLELLNMLETIEIRDHQPEQMIITDQGEF